MMLGFVSAPIMIRQLGPELFGLMALLTSFVAPLGLMDLGIGEATIKYVAESLGRNNRQEAGQYLQSTLCFNLFVGLAGAAVIGLLATWIVGVAFQIAPENVGLARHCLYWLGGIWLATQVRQTFVGAITALQDYKTVSLGVFLTQAVHTMAGLSVLLAGGGLLRMIQTQAVWAVLSVVAWWWLAQSRLPDLKLRPSLHWASFRQTFHFGLWQMLNNLCGILTHQGQRWLLGVHLPVAAVGFYNVGNQLVTMIYSAAHRIGQVLFPAISRMQGEGRVEEAGKLMVQASWMLTTLVIPAFVVLATFSMDVLTLWVGPAVASKSSGALRIMAVGFSFGCLFAIPSFFLLGTGRSRWMTGIAVAQGVVALGAALILIPLSGVSGAAAAVAGGTIPVYSGTLILIWRRLLRRSIPGAAYFSASFVPVLVAAALFMLLPPLRDALPAWQPGWLTLILSSALGYAVLWALIQGVNWMVPGGPERWRQMARLIESTLGSFAPRSPG